MVGVVIILLLLALAVYERETVAAIAFSAVLLLCLQPQYSPPVIHAGSTAKDELSDVYIPLPNTIDDVIGWNGTAWEDIGQVVVSDGDGTYTFESGGVDGGWPRNQHRDSAK